MEISRARPIALAEHGSAEWHAARLRGIGASEAAAACGLSEYETPLELWARKVGRIPAKEASAAMVRGTRFEPILLEAAQEQTGTTLKSGPQTLYRHADHEWLLATPDGEFDDGGQTILECKSSASRRVIDLINEGNPPPEYFLQCQQQLAVTGAQTCVLLVATPDPWKFFDLTTLRIERDDETIEMLIQLEQELWLKVLSEIEPEPDFTHASTCELMRRIYAPSSDEADIISLDDEHAGEWAEYERLAEEIKALDERKKACKAKVLHAIGEHFGGAIGDGRMVRRKFMPAKIVEAYERDGYVDVRAVKVPKGVRL